ncbi:MAG: amidohydrolase family protein [Woeseiaceae bacterium]|nr:amidohydrolase family protein [Woeseiaceae bacterium]
MRRVVLITLAALVACAPNTQDTPFDVLIVNGTVYDGSTDPATQRNVGVRGGLIVTTSAPPDAAATTVVDASGLLVFPGFIDPHTHAPTNAADPEATAHRNFLTQGITTVIVGNDGRGVPGREATLAALERAGSGTNVAFFAGHGTIRRAVMNLADRAPDAAELDTMRRMVSDEMDAGALGLSTGLFYAPGSYAATDEVVELARVAAEMGGIYDTHLRDEGSYNIGVVAAVEEAIDVGHRAGLPVHISHIKALGTDSWGLSRDIIAVIDAARTDGIDVTANQYPWVASNTRLASALVPRWVMAGTPDEMRTRLRDPSLQARIRSEMTANLGRRGGPGAMLITSRASEWRGRTLEEIARVLELDPIAAAIEVVLSEDPSIASFVMNQEDIDRLRVQPWLMTGSDGGDGHPRFFASYPKAWRDFVVDRELLSAERFVNSSTGQVADTLRLCSRGYVRPGYAADIAIVDPDTFLPHATFEEPYRLSTGVVHLLVNGRIVIGDAKYLGTRAGTVLRSDRAPCE